MSNALGIWQDGRRSRNTNSLLEGFENCALQLAQRFHCLHVGGVVKSGAGCDCSKGVAGAAKDPGGWAHGLSIRISG